MTEGKKYTYVREGTQKRLCFMSRPKENESWCMRVHIQIETHDVNSQLICMPYINYICALYGVRKKKSQNTEFSL